VTLEADAVKRGERRRPVAEGDRLGAIVNRASFAEHADTKNVRRQRRDLDGGRPAAEAHAAVPSGNHPRPAEWLIRRRRGSRPAELREQRASPHRSSDNGTLRRIMPRLDVAVRGGALVDGAVADIGIEGERIVQIGGDFEAAVDLDARGKLVLPGGVDAHVHLSNPPREGGPAWVDDFTSGSAAALAGGVTTVGNMTFGATGESLREALARDTAIAQSQTIADVFLHPVLAEPTARNLADIPHLLEDGCSSIKIFLSNASFDRDLDGFVQAVQLAGESGLMTMLHCEDAVGVRHATRRLVERGQTALKYFGASRPVVAEVTATQRAVGLAELTGAPVYLVHLSSRLALEACVAARARGVHVYVETRPLYLHLTDAVFEGAEAGRFVGQPPLRAASDVEALWAGLAAGQVHTVCTDHAPWSLEAKLAADHTIEHLRPGVENLQLLRSMLFSEGVRGGRISLQRMVELTSTNAARLFGLYPRKGSLAVGGDADLVIFDPSLVRTVSGSMLKSNADYSVYEGREVTGWPTLTLRRGEIVFRDDEVLGRPGSGRILTCGPAGHP
jgi:dihydropyrimidinase